MTCTCGATLPEGAKFCGACGATLAAPAPAQPPAPVYQEPPRPMYQEPEPVCQEPVQPAWQESAWQQPAYQEPVYQQPAYQQPAYQQPMYQQPVYQQPAAEEPPPVGRYAPISALGYLGYYIVFAIPVIGLIMSIVWAKDREGSINRQNLAKLMLVFMLLGVAVALIAAIFTAIYWSTAVSFFQQAAGGLVDLPVEFFPS